MNKDLAGFIEMSPPVSFFEFKKEVLQGLSNSSKHLNPKYFYDQKGDALFQRIMALPEYYPTSCELDIFKNNTAELAGLIAPDDSPFDIIELGAGDAMKSKYLLQHLVEDGKDFTYMPIDISSNILNVLENTLNKELPTLKIEILVGEYFSMLAKAASLSSRPKVILFLGGNIGNMEFEGVNTFCNQLYNSLSSGDKLLIGFDLKKNPHIILNAYNDVSGITAKFNLNLLTRMNRELDADFILEQFQHYQMYDPVSGACRSFLVSLIKQRVSIGETTIYFEEDEVIHMEISQKFSLNEIYNLAKEGGFKTTGMILDSKKWFVNTIWQV